MKPSTSEDCAARLRPYVQDRVVHDLGCGNLRQVPFLLSLGAQKVIGIDQEVFHGFTEFKHPQLEFYRQHFHEVSDPIDVAFVSWPVNWDCGLQHLVQRAKTVIYVGKNTDGLMCGDLHFWRTLVSRPVGVHIPHQKETVIVYESGYLDRGLLPEEHAALHLDRVWSFEEVLALGNGGYIGPGSTDSEGARP